MYNESTLFVDFFSISFKRKRLDPCYYAAHVYKKSVVKFTTMSVYTAYGLGASAASGAYAIPLMVDRIGLDAG